MAKSNKTGIQKLILEYIGGATILFCNDNSCFYEICSPEGELVDLYYLVASCFEVVNESILTCSCGYPPCAGFDKFKTQITEKEIVWNIWARDGEATLRFEKNQYIDQVKNILEELIRVCGNGILKDSQEDEFCCNTLTSENLEMFYSPFINPTLTVDRSPLRHKIIINPGNKYICLTENGQKIFFNKENLIFNDTDVFGQPLIYSIDGTDIKKWYNEMQKPGIDWEKWNKKGLKLAKYIRRSLPLAFDIWYQYQNVEKNELVQLPL